MSENRTIDATWKTAMETGRAAFSHGAEAVAAIHFRRALECACAFAANDLRRGETLEALADCAWLRGEFTLSRHLRRQHLEQLAAVVGNSHPNYGAVLINLAAAAAQLGEYENARRAAAEASAIFDRLGAPGRARSFEALELAGHVCSRAGEIADNERHPRIARRWFGLAAEYYDQALALVDDELDRLVAGELAAEAALGQGGPPFAAAVLDLLGQHAGVLSTLGRLREARALRREAAWIELLMRSHDELGNAA